MFNLKKNIVIGVSISPENGLEVAQVDFENKVVLKYCKRALAYDRTRKEIADLDIFKETLIDILMELNIPKGSEIVLNFPTIAFKVSEYPAALDETQVFNAVSEELAEHPILSENEPCISTSFLSNSTIQFNRVASIALQQSMLVEIGMIIEDLGYTPIAIDTSVNSTLNALEFSEKIDCNGNSSWVLLIVEDNTCRIISMQGKNYVDFFEESAIVGEVLGDDENYKTITEVANPVLRNIPSSYLCVVSKTNAISAEKLANQLTYNAPIVHLEANAFAQEPIIDVSDEVAEEDTKAITLDVIGAAIKKNVEKDLKHSLNLFNSGLGDVYTVCQPVTIKIAGREIELTLEKMIAFSIIFAAITLLLTILTYIGLSGLIRNENATLSEVENEIQQIQAFLKKNEGISAELFDEGDEIRIGLTQNKNIYTYYTIVGTEIPQKLWLTNLYLSDKTVIEGQADNLESIYSFYRNIKDYNPTSAIKLQKLGLASKVKRSYSEEDDVDAATLLTSLNADFYEFKISDMTEKDEEERLSDSNTNKETNKDNVNNSDNTKGTDSTNNTRSTNTKNIKKSVAPYKVLE